MLWPGVSGSHGADVLQTARKQKQMSSAGEYGTVFLNAPANFPLLSLEKITGKKHGYDPQKWLGR